MNINIHERRLSGGYHKCLNSQQVIRGLSGLSGLSGLLGLLGSLPPIPPKGDPPPIPPIPIYKIRLLGSSYKGYYQRVIISYKGYYIL